MNAKTQELVEKIVKNRECIEDNVVNIEKDSKELIEKVCGQIIDVRNAHLFEKKIQLITNAQKTILDHRKFIQDSLVQEINLRKEDDLKGGEKLKKEVCDIMRELSNSENFNEQVDEDE